MRDVISIGNSYPNLSPLAVRHLLDLFGSDHPLPEYVPAEFHSASWGGEIPEPSALGIDSDALRKFQKSTANARAVILRAAVTSTVGIPATETPSEREALASGFIVRRTDGTIHNTDASHRTAALAAADPEEVSAALPNGNQTETDDPAARLERAGTPTWAVAWLRRSADRELDPVLVATLIARAANIAAFEGDLSLARRLIAQGAARSESGTLLRMSAPARALTQLLQEDDVDAAHRTLQETLDRGDSADVLNQCLTVLALRCMVDPREPGWAEFITRVTTLGSEAHPVLRRIASTMSTVNAPDAARISEAQPDRKRSWVEVSQSIADVLDAFKTMRLTGHATTHHAPTVSSNTLAELVRTTFLSHVQIQSQLWSTAERTAASGLLLAHRVGSNLLALNSEAMLAVVEAFRGDRDQASKRVERVLANPGIRRAHRLRAVTESVVILLEGSRGSYDISLALLLTRRPDHLSLTVGPYGPIEVFDFVDFALQLNMVTEARKRLDESALAMRDFRSTRAEFVLRACEAMLDADDSLAHLERLLLEAEDLPFLYETARLRLVYAERLRRARRITEARHQLLRVRMDFQNIGAVAWIDRVQRELRTTTREPVDVTSTMTEQETRVADLAASGFSNKEIGRRLYLSPRTVAGHLYRLFPKLGVTTRAQLRDALNGAITAPEPRSSGSVTPSGHDSRSMSQPASSAPAR